MKESLKPKKYFYIFSKKVNMKLKFFQNIYKLLIIIKYL